LRAARDAGRPYHVVHFDGHGTYRDVAATSAAVPVSAELYGPSLAAPARPGQHGYLLFEKPGSGSNQELVDGPTLAALLVETRVPVLVLNACRSAYAEAPPAPDPALTEVHERVRAYGSLAAEVADQGVAGVVAMRYNVYVVTAAQFVADLYTQLLAGRTLGEAATAGRQALAADPTRALGAAPVNLQDWMVPTVYEAAPCSLVDRPAEQPPRLTLHGGDARARTDGGVPGAPDIGFFGRDEALLALDRAFDTDRIVLLHALAGAGKTTTAAEFTRWYLATGGLRHDDGQGMVLWTSFEDHMPLDRVLDAAGAVFAPQLEANDIHWDAITDPVQRRDLVLQVLAQVPVLWVWDNVEPVTGFPAGTASAWTGEEQAELREFLRALRDQTRAKVLLTSRRDEHPWLGELPQRVQLAPMPMWESLQLIRTLVDHLGASSGDIDWRGLARFAGGNPLTITVTVRQAVLREHVTTTEQVDAFLARVQAGHTPLEATQNADLGRSESLAASLAYGFAHAFTESEHARLALLHLFRDAVNVAALQCMGNPDVAGDDAVAALAGADRESLSMLLGRAAELGLLTEYGNGFYGIHPALPWFFTDLFARHTPDPAAAERAYAHAYAILGRYHFDQVEEGRAVEVLSVLRAEEANLRHGLHLARAHHLPTAALSCAQGLCQLCDLTGRTTEWARLVADIQGDYIDPGTDQPRPGREDDYGIITEYRVQIARARRDWPTATRLHTIRAAWDRDRAAPYLDLAPEQLDPTGRNRLRTLAVGEHLLGQLLFDQGDPACRDHFQAAYHLAGRIGDTPTQAVAASGLGTVYRFVPGLRDLDQAHHWHQHDLDLKPERDRIGRAASHISLASVAFERFREARAVGAPADHLAAHLEQARAGYQQALDLLPDDHHQYRAVAHDQLGTISSAIGDVPCALGHYQQSIRYSEARGDTYVAGGIRFHIALLLGENGRAGDALHYARTALTNFQQVGPGAAAMAGQAEALIQELEREAAP
jgi:tetratricopeptide (TPR) repeat protein